MNLFKLSRKGERRVKGSSVANERAKVELLEDRRLFTAATTISVAPTRSFLPNLEQIITIIDNDLAASATVGKKAPPPPIPVGCKCLPSQIFTVINDIDPGLASIISGEFSG